MYSSEIYLSLIFIRMLPGFGRGRGKICGANVHSFVPSQLMENLRGSIKWKGVNEGEGNILAQLVGIWGLYERVREERYTKVFDGDCTERKKIVNNKGERRVGITMRRKNIIKHSSKRWLIFTFDKLARDTW